MLDHHNDQEERRSYRRVELTLAGRFMISDAREYPCEVANISASGALLRSHQPPPRGENVVVYLDQIGRMSGKVLRNDGDRFAIHAPPSNRQCDRFIDRATWLLNSSLIEAEDHRQETRHIPKQSTSTLTTADGKKYKCDVIDISLGGISVKTNVAINIGAIVQVGLNTGAVIRHHDEGFAIELINKLKSLDDDNLKEFDALRPLPKPDRLSL